MVGTLDIQCLWLWLKGYCIITGAIGTFYIQAILMPIFKRSLQEAYGRIMVKVTALTGAIGVFYIQAILMLIFKRSLQEAYGSNFRYTVSMRYGKGYCINGCNWCLLYSSYPNA